MNVRRTQPFSEPPSSRQEENVTEGPAHRIEYSISDIDPWDGIGVAYQPVLPGLNPQTIEDFMISTASRALGKKLVLNSNADNAASYMTKDKTHSVRVTRDVAGLTFIEGPIEAPPLNEPPDSIVSREEFEALVIRVKILEQA